VSQTLHNGLDVIEYLARTGSARLVEVAGELGVSRPTAFRLLAALQQRGYVEHVPAESSYRLGSQLHAVASSAEGSALLRLARPVLTELAELTGETVNLAVVRRDRLVYEDIREASHALRMAIAIGDRLPAHCSGLGKSILAAGDDALRDALLGEEPYSAMTPRTITRRGALERDLARVASRGWALDDQESVLGGIGIGAAIVAPDGRPVAALSVSGPSARLTRERIPEVAALVTARAARLSEAWRATVGIE
jgi:IclR family acetate operon transcriptional repressor